MPEFKPHSEIAAAVRAYLDGEASRRGSNGGRMSFPITAHLDLREFSCHDGTPYPAEWITDRLKPLYDTIEAIREACGGRRVRIVSGYRTAEYNEAKRKRVEEGTVVSLPSDGSGSGVAQDSQHIEGRGADIAVDGLTPSEVHEIALTLFVDDKLPHLGGIARYPGWVHVDVRPRPANGHLARWGIGLRDTPRTL